MAVTDDREEQQPRNDEEDCSGDAENQHREREDGVGRGPSGRKDTGGAVTEVGREEGPDIT